MSFAFATDSRDSFTEKRGAWKEVLDRNAATNLAVVAGISTAALGTYVYAAVAPGVLLSGAAVTGGLAYAGHRQFTGQSLNPFTKDDTEPKKADAKSEKTKAEAIKLVADGNEIKAESEMAAA